MHELPQVPQFEGSVDSFTQAVPHQVRPVEQQWPALQSWPELQALPQPPQFLSSVSVSTHWGEVPAPQSAIPVPALQVQAPPAQAPRPQRWPHEPQLFSSTTVSTHWGEAAGPHEV